MTAAAGPYDTATSKVEHEQRVRDPRALEVNVASEHRGLASVISTFLRQALLAHAWTLPLDDHRPMFRTRVSPSRVLHIRVAKIHSPRVSLRRRNTPMQFERWNATCKSRLVCTQQELNKKSLTLSSHSQSSRRAVHNFPPPSASAANPDMAWV